MDNDREQKLILLESLLEKFVDGKPPKEKSEMLNTDFKKLITIGGESFDSCVEIYYPAYESVLVSLFSERSGIITLRPMLKEDFDALVNKIMILPSDKLTSDERKIRSEVETMGLPLL